MAAPTAVPASSSPATFSQPAHSLSPPPPRISFRRWLILHRFHLMSALFLSSTAVTVYRMYEQRRVQDELEQQGSELDVELSKVQRLTERRRQLLQQQLHSLWASPPTATAVATAVPSAVASASASLGGWFSLSGLKRWWQRGNKHDSSPTVTSAHSTASLQLPLCGSSIHLQQLASLPASPPPSAAFMASAVSDCDYLLHTGTLPPTSPFATSTTTAASPVSTTSNTGAASVTTGAVVTRQSSQSVTGGVTGGGKRLLV